MDWKIVSQLVRQRLLTATGAAIPQGKTLLLDLQRDGRRAGDAEAFGQDAGRTARIFWGAQARNGDATTGLVLYAAEVGSTGNKVRVVVTGSGSLFSLEVSLPNDDPAKEPLIVESYTAISPGGSINITGSRLIGRATWLTALAPPVGEFRLNGGKERDRSADVPAAREQLARTVAAAEQWIARTP